MSNKQTTSQSPGMVEFIVIISLIMSLVALAIDAMLPALEAIGDDLAVSNRNDLQFIISVLFLGMALGQMVFGPLSDSLGRKPTIYIGFGLFMAGCLISSLAHTFELMLVGRLLQGIGASSPRIVTVALVRDTYSGRAMARVMSFSMSIFILVPVLAPALGQWVAQFAGWRGIFISFLVLAFIVLIWFGTRLQESLPKSQRSPFSPREIAQNLVVILSNKIVSGYTLAMSFLFGAFIAYLSLSQKILQIQYNLGTEFPLSFGVLAGSIGIASLVNANLVMRFGMQRLSIIAMFATFLLSLLFLIFAYNQQGHPSLFLLMSYFIVLFFFVGILFGNLNALAMEPLSSKAGLGAALIGSISTLLSVIFGVIIADLHNGTVIPLVMGFTVFCFLGLLTMQWVHKYASQAQ